MLDDWDECGDNQIPRFWMVMNVTVGSPTSKMHKKKSSAVQEAKRLSTQQPSDRFAVLESIMAFQCPVPVPEELEIITVYPEEKKEEA